MTKTQYQVTHQNLLSTQEFIHSFIPDNNLMKWMLPFHFTDAENRLRVKKGFVTFQHSLTSFSHPHIH